MSNVLIGIVGVILFVGLALAGASLFGPVVQDAVHEGRGMGAFKVMSATANAVVQRNRDLETATPAAPDSSALVPDYFDSYPVNPDTGEDIMLLSSAGLPSGGPAAIVATRIESSSDAMCRFMNRNGGGADGSPTAATIPTQRSGCIKLSADSGYFHTGDYVGYLWIG